MAVEIYRARPASAAARPRSHLVRRQRPPIIAAAERLDLRDRHRIDQHPKQAWQSEIFSYLRAIGEFRHGVSMYANSLARVALRAGRVVAPGVVEPVDDGPAADHVANLAWNMSGPLGSMHGHAAMMYRLAEHLVTAGESNLVGVDNEDGQAEWEVLSVDELDTISWPYTRRRHPGASPEALPDGSAVLRIWRPDAQFSALAQSSSQPLIDRLEEMYVLGQQVIAGARSRLNAGVAFIADEATLEDPPDDEDGEVDQVDSLSAQFLRLVSKPVSDPRSVMALAPLLLRAPGEMLDKVFKHFTFAKDEWEKDVELRQEAVARFREGFEFPAPALEGMGEVKFWNAQQIEDQTYRVYIEPGATVICDALTPGYLQPIMREVEQDPAWRSYVVVPDPTDLIADPDQGSSADEGLDQIVISEEAWRRAKGYEETDAPEEAEYRRRVGIKLGDVGLALGGERDAPAGLSSLPADSGVPAPPIPDQPPVLDQDPAPPDTPPVPPGVTAAGSPRRDLTRLARALVGIDQMLREQLAVDAEATMRRAFEQAGARLRSKLTATKAKTMGVDWQADNGRLAALVGRDRLAELGVAEDALVAKAVDGLRERAEKRLAAAQQDRRRRLAREVGVDAEAWDDEEEADDAERGAGLIAGAVLALVVSRLYAPDGPPTRGEVDVLSAPRGAVREGMAAAGGADKKSQGVSVADRLRGVAVGRRTIDVLRGAGVELAGVTWVYGPAPREPFAPHEDLDGETFTSEEDPRLAVGAEGDWLDVGFYWPGDHDGCACDVMPVFAELVEVLDESEEAA